MRKLMLVTALFAATLCAVEAQTRTTKSGYLASISQEMLSKADLYLAQNDEAAVRELIAAGAVIQLKAGIQIEIVETKLLSGLVKVRPRGSTLEFWTNIEAIRQ